MSNINSKTGSSTQYGIKTLVMRIQFVRRRRTRTDFFNSIGQNRKGSGLSGRVFGLPRNQTAISRSNSEFCKRALPHRMRTSEIQDTLSPHFSHLFQFRQTYALLLRARGGGSIYQMKIQREVVMPDQPSIPKYANKIPQCGPRTSESGHSNFTRRTPLSRDAVERS